ncbi:TetR-like C-terminal domain-containing protein [Micromonospora sp. DT46]|uniref:TetR-like C-terminal domain-containing protein n=1 Tax=unclassified Micromonospora TaxID=2617518 RepID=UPI002E1367B4|nr:TetR/AcrR family transcriptional regulator C-terminal ligand-binding domain-containing protein [Micromonospora sp. NBC_01740]
MGAFGGAEVRFRRVAGGQVRVDLPHRLIAESQHDAGLAAALTEQLVGPRVAVAKQRLARAQQQGQLPVDADLQLIVELLYGPVYYRHLLHLGPYSRDRLRELVDRVLDRWS